MAIRTPDNVYRDYETDGVPSSGEHEPIKSEIRGLLNQMQITGGSLVTTETKADLDAITDKDDFTGGLVLNDPTASNNGYYIWETSAWTRQRGLPDSATVLTGVAGTNDVTADTDAGIDPSETVILILEPANTNTGAMTLALNGGSSQPFRTYAGAEFASGAIVAGYSYLVYDTGSEYRALNDDRILPYQGAYAGGTTYALGDLVENGGSIWYSLQDSNTGNTPTEGSFWTEFLPGVTVADNSITNAKLTAAHSLSLSHTVANRTALKALDTSRYNVAFVQGLSGGRFVWDSSDLSTEVAADTQEGIYVPPTADATGASGAWVRDYQSPVNVLWWGAIGDNSTDDATACQEAADTGEDVVFPEGYTFLVSAEIDATAHGQKFIVKGTIRTTSSINALIRSTDYDDVLVEGKGTVDAGGTATNCVHFIADTRNTYRNRARGVTCTGTVTDATLQRAGILFDTTGGKAGTFRHKDVSAVDVVIDDVETHGILTAYCDGVRIIGNRINDCRNHGHESVNCTDVIQTLNQVSDCLISGLGVGDNCLNWTISNNVIRNCAGDGAITCEHNSVRGSIHNNQIYDAYGSACINVSYGTPVAGEFSTIHDISVFGNNCHAKAGYPTIRGVLCYASTSGSEGYAIDISHNKFDNIFLGMDISYLTDSQFCKNTVTSFQGSSGYTAAILTYVTNSELDGLNVKAATDDHAVKVVAFGASLSDRCTIKGVKTFTCPTTKSIVYIDNGTLFNCYDLETNTANYGVEVGTGSTSYNAAGIIGNFVSGSTTGGTKLTWQA